MKTILSIIVALCVLIPSGFYAAKTVSDASFGEPNIAYGEVVYRGHCLACHGPKGLGNSAAADAMTVKPDSIYEELTNPYGFKAELIASVLTGDNGQGGTMPAFQGILNESDVNDIFGYILSVNEVPAK